VSDVPIIFRVPDIQEEELPLADNSDTSSDSTIKSTKEQSMGDTDFNPFDSDAIPF
jgi:hypothetical protein